MQKQNKNPIIIELIGPAGAGKTTILKSICLQDKRIRAGVHVNKIVFIIFLIINTLFLSLTYLFNFKRDRWFSWKEIRAMVYLKAWHFILNNRQSGKNRVIILDHGPIFRLAFLDEFGPDFRQNSPYSKWMKNVLETWHSTLDGVIWLDAPNDILLKRIQERKRWHEIKEKSNDVGIEYLNRYRKSCKKMISKFNDDIKLLEFNTQKKSPDLITDVALKLFDSIEKDDDN